MESAVPLIASVVYTMLILTFPDCVDESRWVVFSGRKHTIILQNNVRQ